ncbi:TonB-dependent receptor [Sphingomonas sp. BK235]|uniref:TonB-dependent receptor n=1 Tax=Sphingomonas sp. BK235 TaxID=2512131 RepID=UPI00104A02E7|nr:TonB-dependent receptor [Sphingomonas sp. BK235]TCP31036.1 TonB-dependent receptor-like protein [Sphingomonas sp. BK235]
MTELKFRLMAATALVTVAQLPGTTAAQVADAVAQTAAPADTTVGDQAADPSSGADQSDIVVTGSRIRRIDGETASPVFTFGQEQIQESGFATVGDIVRQLPNIAGGGMSPADNSYGGTGRSDISLRGLGADRTLLLIDGVRFFARDVNALPANMIERVEVLKDGASAIYGSDAIAGVVNFITKRKASGVDLSAYYGISDKGDVPSLNLQGSIAHSFDRGSLMVGGTYMKQQPMLNTARDWADTPYALTNGNLVFAGSPATPTGRFTVPRSAAVAANPGLNCSNPGNVAASAVFVTRATGAAGTSAGDFRCFIGAGDVNDTYNDRVETQLLTPQERYSVFGSGTYKLADNLSLYASGFYTHTLSDSTLASDYFQTQAYGVTISGRSIYNPFGVDIPDVRQRLVNNGQRIRTYDRDDVQLSTGLKGKIGDFDWDVNYSYADQRIQGTRTGSIYLPAIQAAIGPSFVDAGGTARCGVPGATISGCTPINIFSEIPVGALTAISPGLHSNWKSSQHDVLANVTGTLFTLPAGPVGIAVGGEYRKLSSEYAPDYLLANKLMDVQYETAVKGSYNVKEVYGEVNVPLLRDVPLIQSLDVNAGVRYSDYSTFGGTTNYKVGAQYRPVSDLLIRGTYARVFRSPTIEDLYSGQYGDTPTITDPCNAPAAGSGACAAVPAGFIGDRQPPTTNGGNPNLSPETGNTLTAGAVFSPSFLRRLTLSADYWQYDIKGAIGAPGAQTVLDLCYRQNIAQYCALVSRNGLGQITNISNLRENIGGIRTAGVDVSVKYSQPTDIGTFRLSFDGTYTDSYRSTAISAQPTTAIDYAGFYRDSTAGGEGNFAKFRSLTMVNFDAGGFALMARHRFISGVDVRNLDTAAGTACAGTTAKTAQAASGPVTCRYEIGAANYVDLSAGYDFEQGVRMTIGVNNLLDRGVDPLTRDFRTYDILGRYMYVQVSAHFG